MKLLLLPLLVCISLQINAFENTLDSLRSFLPIETEDEKRIVLTIEKGKNLVLSNPDSALYYMQESLEKAKAISYDEGINWAYDGLSYYYIKQQDYAISTKYYKKQLHFNKLKKDYKELSRLYNAIALNNQFLGKLDTAIYYHELATNYTLKTGDTKRLAQSYNNIAVIYAYRGEYYKALDNFFLSVQMKEEFQDTIALIDSYSNIAVMYFYIEDYEKSLQYYRKCIALNSTIQNKPRFANTYNNMASVYKRKAMYDSALYFHKKSLQLKLALKDKKGISASYHNIGDIYLILNKLDSSYYYATKAMQLKKQIGHKRGILINHTLLSTYFQHLGNIDSALYHAKAAYALSEDLKSIDYKKEAAQLLHEIEFERKNYEVAYNYLLEYLTLNDSIFNNENIKKIAQLESKYEREKLELKHHEELKQQKFLRNIFIAGLIVLIIFSSVLARYFYERQKASRIIEKKNKQITDSINYAKHIQDAMLPSSKLLKSSFQESLIYYAPKDIVSGDFYWFKQMNNKIYIAVADCTGHGVPGALMSMMGMSFLNEIVSNSSNFSANEILANLREKVMQSLKQTGDHRETRDGMDMAIIIINKTNLHMQYAGANNPLLLIREHELIELEPDLMPVGIYFTGNKPFTNHSMQLEPNDLVFMFSDGYYDQIGGPKMKKFLSSNFKKMLREHAAKPLSEQKQILSDTFNNWKSDYDQLDDVLVVGFKV